jgi:hypothetical protein
VTSLKKKEDDQKWSGTGHDQTGKKSLNIQKNIDQKREIFPQIGQITLSLIFKLWSITKFSGVFFMVQNRPRRFMWANFQESFLWSKCLFHGHMNSKFTHMDQNRSNDSKVLPNKTQMVGLD